MRLFYRVLRVGLNDSHAALGNRNYPVKRDADETSREVTLFNDILNMNILKGLAEITIEVRLSWRPRTRIKTRTKIGYIGYKVAS